MTLRNMSCSDTSVMGPIPVSEMEKKILQTAENSDLPKTNPVS